MTADVVAERQLLAMALSGHPSMPARFAALPVAAFTDPVHAIVGTVLRDRFTRRVPVDALTIAADAAAAAGTDHQSDTVRQFVRAASITAPPLSSWEYYAEVVVTYAAARQAWQVGQRLAQRLDGPVDGDGLAAAVSEARDRLETLDRGPVTVEPPLSLQALMDEQAPDHDWLVPNLLERMDRLIVTGYEGTGKSFLLAQFALTIAAGLHPFAGTLINPAGMRVLVLDCENSKWQVKRRYESTVGRVNLTREEHGLTPVDWSQHLRFVLRPEGVDLADGREFSRIESAIAATAPDLVLAGPLYRMHKANINEEQAARELVDALDRLRVKYRFTLICEAHVGHVGETSGGRRLRPTGSSLFLRWPEFGYGIRGFGEAQAEEHPSTVELVAWRGARDERNWPHLLRHSQTELPWTPADPKYRDDFGMGVFRGGWPREQEAS